LSARKHRARREKYRNQRPMNPQNCLFQHFDWNTPATFRNRATTQGPAPLQTRGLWAIPNRREYDPEGAERKVEIGVGQSCKWVHDSNDGCQGTVGAYLWELPALVHKLHSLYSRLGNVDWAGVP